MSTTHFCRRGGKYTPTATQDQGQTSLCMVDKYILLQPSAIARHRPSVFDLLGVALQFTSVPFRCVIAMQYLGSGSGCWMTICRGAKRLPPALRSYIDMDRRACRTVKRSLRPLHLVSIADYRGYHRGQSQQPLMTNGSSTLHISISNSLRCRAIACTAHRFGLLRDVGLIPSTNKTNQYRSISIQHDEDDFDFPPLDLLTPSLAIPLPPNMRQEKPTQVNDGYHHQQDIRTGVGSNDLKSFSPVYTTEGSSFPNKDIDNTKTRMEGRASGRGKRGTQSRIRNQLRRHLRHQEERRHRFPQIRQRREEHESVVSPDDAPIRGSAAEQQRHDREGDLAEKGADRPAEFHEIGGHGDVEIFFETLPINKQSPYIIMMATNCVDGEMECEYFMSEKKRNVSCANDCFTFP